MIYVFGRDADIPVGPRALGDFGRVEVEVLNESPWDDQYFHLKMTPQGIKRFEKNQEHLDTGLSDFILNTVLKDWNGEIRVEAMDTEGTEDPMYETLMEAWTDEFGELE